MRETLRLAPSGPFRFATPLENTTLAGGKYAVRAGDTIMCGVYQVHRDPKVWGDDVRSIYAGAVSSLMSFVGRQFSSRAYVGREVRGATCESMICNEISNNDVHCSR